MPALPTDTSRFPLREAFAFAAFAFVYRLLYYVFLGGVIDTADAIHYLTAAETFAKGALLSADPRIPPLYPLLTAVLVVCGLDAEQSASIVSLIAGSIAILPVYAIALRLFGRNTARIIAIFFALWPWMVDYAGRVAPETLALLLWCWAALALLKAVRGEGSFWLPAILYFLLHLTRPEGILIAAAAGLIAVVLLDGPTRARLMRAWWNPAIAAALFFALFFGYMIWMRAASGEVALSPRIGNPADALRFTFVERGRDTLAAYLQLFTHTLPVMLGPFVLFFTGIGVLMPNTANRDTRAEWFFALLASAQFVVAGLSTYAEPRYIMTSLVIAAIFAAAGMDSAGRAWSRKRSWLRHAPVVLLAALLLVGMAAVAAPRLAASMSYLPVEYKVAGQWMRDNLDHGLIFTRKPQVGYYAGMPSTGPAPADTIEQAIDRAREAGARYFVIDERYTAQMAPALRPLLDPANAPPSLRLIRDDLSPLAEARIVIYELVEP